MILKKNVSITKKLVFILLCVSLITPLGLIVYILLIGNQTQDELHRLLIKEQQQKSVLFFENSLHNVYSDIIFLSRIVQQSISSDFKKNNGKTQKHISQTFRQLLEANSLYQQIRLIDSTGKEHIRLDQRKRQIVRTKFDKLQNKSGNYYVNETLNLQIGEIYISELDLNRENGRIETPFNPTIRIATKLNDGHGQFQGIIVINISAKVILDNIINSEKHGGKTFLVDEKGRYIIHPQPEKKESTRLGKKQSIVDDFPKLRLLKNGFNKNRHAVYKTKTQQFHVCLIDSDSKMNRHWFLITVIPNLSIWNQIQQETVLIISAISGILISILLGNYVSRRWIVKPIRYMEGVSQQLIEGNPVDLINYCKHNYEIGLLCKKLNKMANIISNSRQEKEQFIESLSKEVTNRKKIGQDLLVYKALFEYSSEAMMITDCHEVITHINPAYTYVTGYSKHEVIGKTPRITSSGKQDRFFYKKLWQQLCSQGHWQGEISNKRKNGEVFPVQQSINVVKVNESTAHYVSVFSDITQTKQYEHMLRQHAYYDSLTGLANRALLHDRLNQVIATVHRHKQHAAFLFIDIDNFKHINDSLGHDIGDRLLQNIAKRLNDGFRENDTISRFGGDEFIILITNLPSDPKASYTKVEHITNNLLKLMAMPYLIDQQVLHISSSIGICIFSEKDNHNPEEIIKMADIAMYAAKNEGKSTYRFYNSEMQEKAHQRLYIENGLREAIKQEQLVLFYQCQYTDKKELLGMEALVRWQHPKQGLIFPNDFIPIAEESGLIVAMGEVIIRQACLQIKQWEKEGHTIPHISVNVSPKQFAEKNFVDQVCAICKETDIPSEQLVLELTEATIVSDIENTIEKMSQLQQLGHQISIDDFGTGYSSLAYLKKLPINQLKIDKTFVDDINPGNEETIIVNTIIAMAQNLKLNLIAEGVENQFQVEYLHQRGCLGFQGYYFCKPVPATEVFSKKTIKIKEVVLC